MLYLPNGTTVDMHTVHAYVNVFIFVACNMQFVHLLAHTQHVYIAMWKAI